jgi:C4-dicarboxylate transporter
VKGLSCEAVSHQGGVDCVAGSVKREPLEIVKRTSVPMIAGTVVMFVLSMVIFL